jgi:hypothetical protein
MTKSGDRVVCDPCGIDGVLNGPRHGTLPPIESKMIDGIMVLMCVDPVACRRRAENNGRWKST